MTNLKDKPFALIGVHSWSRGPGALKAAMTKNGINWRTFDDAGDINRRWNRPATPSMFIIDHKGKIRRKWTGKIGEKTIDAALQKLILEAQQSEPPK